ncbi:hypothetical protein [Shewanella sp. UCD-KL21]|uniref:hypothetical protein n=1 Tax=Shewanella sp. UCD-KL21 TaxID=1917164 RepID=UPI000970983B|nr:hypothetical protein [Shewanella sp. UCD-KL21]
MVDSHQGKIKQQLSAVFLTDYKISKLQFNLLIFLAIIWGGVSNYLAIRYIPIEWFNMLGFWPILAMYLLCGIAGALLLDQKLPIKIFAGFNIIILGSGILLSFLLQSVAADTIYTFFQYAALMTLLMLFITHFLPKNLLTKKVVVAIALGLIMLIELVSWSLWGVTSNLFSLGILVMVFSGSSSIWAEANEEYDGSVGYCAELDFKLSDAIWWGVCVYMGLVHLLMNHLSKKEPS